MKSNSVITTTTDGMVITFNVKDAGEVKLDLNACHADVLQRAMIHGLIQRVSDAAALSRNPENGQPASPADKLAAMVRLVDHYASGTADWSIRREGGSGGAGAEGGLILRAVAMVQGVSPETMRERLTTLAEKRGTTVRKLLNTLSTQDAVAARIAEIRKASGSADLADGLMDELQG